MNPTLLHRQRGRSFFWVAFMTALAIRLGAVALAKNRSPIRKLEDFNPPADVELVDIAYPASALPEESVTLPPLEQIPSSARLAIRDLISQQLSLNLE